jgi:adenylate kinase family enzyme
MKKIIIIGNSGSGKTWLGQNMATLPKIPCVSLDHIFWEPGGYNQQREDPQVEADLEKILNLDTWLVEGVFGHLVDGLIAFADTLVYIDLPWPECEKNLKDRGSESSKQLDPIEAEENFQTLLEWALVYDVRESKASKKYHDFLYKGFMGDKYKLYSRNEMDQLLEKWRAIIQ